MNELKSKLDARKKQLESDEVNYKEYDPAQGKFVFITKQERDKKMANLQTISKYVKPKQNENAVMRNTKLFQQLDLGMLL